MHNLSRLRPQIREFLNDQIEQGFEADDFALILNNRHHWADINPIAKAKFHHEHANFTMTQLCNMYDLVHGTDLAFADMLRELFRTELAAIRSEEIECGQFELDYEAEAIA